MTDKDIVGLVFIVLIGWLIYEWLWVSPIQRIAPPRKNSPSYISDFEQELAKADIELENSMAELRDDISRVVARELPKVVANGNNRMYLALETSPDDNYRKYSVVKVTEAQYNLIKRHRRDEEWLGNTLFSKELGLYANIVFCSDNYSGVMLDIRVGKG